MRNRKNIIRFLLIAGFAFLYWQATAPLVRTYPPFVKQAQSMGLPAKDCSYCHVKPTGGDPLNARGNWLVQEKNKRGADSVEVAWLKDYKETKATTPEQPKLSKQDNTKSPMPLSAPRSPTKIEPLRSIGGVMLGKTITINQSKNLPSFTYTITQAQLVNGNIQFQGVVRPVKGQAVNSVPARLVSTMATTRPNPVKPNTPSATTTQPRTSEKAAALGQAAQASQTPPLSTTVQPTKQEEKKRDVEEVTEETQSLYVNSEAGSGCEVMYLKLNMPKPLLGKVKAIQPVQLNVILYPRDNNLGIELNGHLCRIVRAINFKTEAKRLETLVSAFNQLLTSGSTSNKKSGNR
jgi:hypothetical protein